MPVERLHLYRNAELHSLQDFGVFGLSYMLPQQLDCHCLRKHDAMTSPAVHATCPRYFVFLKNLTAGAALSVIVPRAAIAKFTRQAWS